MKIKDLIIAIIVIIVVAVLATVLLKVGQFILSLVVYGLAILIIVGLIVGFIKSKKSK